MRPTAWSTPWTCCENSSESYVERSDASDYHAHVRSPVDASDAELVAAAFAEYLRHHAGWAAHVEYVEPPRQLSDGTDTFVYGLRLAGDQQSPWTAHLVLRIFRSTEDAARAEREAAVQRFAREQGYRTPALLSVESAGANLGLPFMVMERAPGTNLLESFRSHPARMFRLIRIMAEAHAALHRVPVEDCPIAADTPLVQRRLEALDGWMSRFDLPEAKDAYTWLQKHSSVVTSEEQRLCHNDFHPLNIVVDEAGGWSVIDWSRAEIGDRLHDVARTHVVMSLAQGGGRSAGERVLLRLSRFVASRYLKSYAHLLPFDRRRLLYWRALLTFQSWVETAPMMSEGAAAIGARSEAATGYPRDIVEKIRREFARCVQEFERHV